MSGGARLRVERATAGDRAFLAMDTGPVPQQFGVVLLLDDAADLDLVRLRDLLAVRVRAVPRLRQRLLGAPFGCGGPVWVDAPSFDVARHVQAVACGTPGDEQSLLDAALDQVMAPLDRDAPLWRAVLVTGGVAGRAAVVVVLHHVLADGVGGLAVLAALVDPGGEVSGGSDGTSSGFPRPVPRRGVLLADAVSRALKSLAAAPRTWRLMRRSLRAGGGLRPPRVADCSLLRPTGPHRRLTVVRADLAPLREAAHRRGGSVNDALLVAVAGALHQLLRTRGEEVDRLVLAVPVSGRGTAADPALGNVVSPVLVEVPATGDLDDRMRSVADQMRVRKEEATGPAPIATLGWIFRPVARLGGYRWYMDHQHRLHALVSHVRGPAEPLRIGGVPIGSAVPVAVAENGNITVSFEAVTYAGQLVVSILVDPGRTPDLEVLTAALTSELALQVDVR